MHWKQLNKTLGNIDLYLLDQLLKGNIPDEARILDAGCGEGRNLVYFMQQGYDVFGVDQNPEAIRYIRLMAKSLKLTDLEARFQEGLVEHMLFPDNTFDLTISSAVLHFARHAEHFENMLQEMVRVLKPDGMLFLRTVSSIGMEEKSHYVDEPQRLMDGSERFVLHQEFLQEMVQRYNLTLVEEPRSVVLLKMRSMGVFVLKKLI